MARQDIITGEPDAWARVGEAIRDRRTDLDLTHTQVASDGGVSMNVWSLLENGKQTTYRRRTMVAVARALRWPDDAIPRLLAGADATELATVAAPARASVAPDHAGEAVTLPAGLARRLRDATPDDLNRLEAYLDGLFAARDR